jgi:hypothetical protein
MLICQINFSHTWNHFRCTYTNNTCRCCSIKETWHISLHTNSLTPNITVTVTVTNTALLAFSIAAVCTELSHNLFNILFSFTASMVTFSIQSYFMWHGFLSINLRDSCSYFWYQLLKMLQLLCSVPSFNGILKMSPHQFHTCPIIRVF